jgi:hypothetical protein
MKTVTIDFYTLNVKVLPPVKDNTKRYAGLLTNWFKKGFRIVTPGDKRHYYTLRTLDKIANGEAYYGILTKFISFDSIDFIDSETGRLLPQPIPKNVEGRINEFEFIFIPKFHRLAFIKTGKIDPTIKKSGAPLKKMTEIVKMAFDNGLKVGQESIVEIVQSKYVFDEIFENDVLSLEVRVSYTNDDSLNKESKKLVHSLLKNGNIGKFYAKLQPDNNKVINTDEALPNGLLQLAEENGTVKAVLSTDEGLKKINSEDFPAVTPAAGERGENQKRSLIASIINIFNKKYKS